MIQDHTNIRHHVGRALSRAPMKRWSYWHDGDPEEFASSVALATVSYAFFEKKFRALKDRFELDFETN